MAMLSFTLEWASSTSGNNAWLAFRMRVSMSEIGSVIDLPTGLGDAGNEPGQCHFAESQPGAAELPDEAMPAATDLAAVHQPDRTGILRQSRQRRVIALGFEFGAQSGVLLDHRGLLFVAFRPSLLSHKSFSFGKGHAHQFQQLARLSIGLRAGNDGHVHSLVSFYPVQFDLRKDRLVVQPERIIAPPVERAPRHSAKVADARQSGGNQAIEKLIHRVAAQGDLAADRLALAQLEIRHAFARLVDDGLASGDHAQIPRGIVHRAFLQRGADAHVDDYLLQAGPLMDVRVLPALHERRPYGLNVPLVKSGLHDCQV